MKLTMEDTKLYQGALEGEGYYAPNYFEHASQGPENYVKTNIIMLGTNIFKYGGFGCFKCGLIRKNSFIRFIYFLSGKN